MDQRELAVVLLQEALVQLTPPDRVTTAIVAEVIAPLVETAVRAIGVGDVTADEVAQLQLRTAAWVTLRLP